MIDNPEVKFSQDKLRGVVKFNHADWHLEIGIDAQQLIFKTVLRQDMWLAVGLAQDLLEADIIQWATTKKDIKE